MIILLYTLFALCSVLSAVIIWFLVDDLRQGKDYAGHEVGAPEGDMQNFVAELNRKDAA